MAIFNYKAVDKEGKEISGQMPAKDKFELYHLLKSGGNTVVSVEEIKEGGGNFSLGNLLSLFGVGGIGTHDKIIMARNLGQMILAGLPITRGLFIMERQAKKGKLKDVAQSRHNTAKDIKGLPSTFNRCLGPVGCSVEFFDDLRTVILHRDFANYGNVV